MQSLSRLSIMQYLFLTVCVITLSSASAANVSTLQLNEREAQDNSEPLPPPWNDSSNDDRINLRSTSSSSQRRELSFWSSIMSKLTVPSIGIPCTVQFFRAGARYWLFQSFILTSSLFILNTRSFYRLCSLSYTKR